MKTKSEVYVTPSIKIIGALAKSMICSSTETPVGNTSVQDYEEETLNW